MSARKRDDVRSSQYKGEKGSKLGARAQSIVQKNWKIRYVMSETESASWLARLYGDRDEQTPTDV